jgi:hypothetical protein
MELEEFCALESEVLREVSNRWVPPGSGSSPGPAAKAGPQPPGPATDQCSAAFNWPGPQPGPLDDDEEEEEDEDEEQDVFQSDGECQPPTFQQQQRPRAQTKSVSFAESRVPCLAAGAVTEEDGDGELEAQARQGRVAGCAAVAAQCVTC